MIIFPFLSVGIAFFEQIRERQGKILLTDRRDEMRKKTNRKLVTLDSLCPLVSREKGHDDMIHTLSTNPWSLSFLREGYADCGYHHHPHCVLPLTPAATHSHIERQNRGGGEVRHWEDGPKERSHRKKRKVVEMKMKRREKVN